MIMDADVFSPAEPDPATFVVQETLGYIYPAALRAVVSLGVAEHLVEQPRTAADLAELTGTDPDFLGRALRLLATKGVFQQDEAGRFHLTARADVLRWDAPRSVAAAVLAFTADFVWTPTARLEEALRSGRPAFQDCFGTSFFGHLAADPEQARLFDEGLAAFSGGADGSCAISCDLPDSGVLVDVGGGRGGFLAAALQRHPGLRGVLYEREGVQPGRELAELDRWEVESGDFFEHVPAGGDCYALKYVLHDWDDDSCVRILRNCRDAMAPGGRVLVIDSVLPDGDEPHAGKTMDVFMLVLLPGRERTAADFARLFAAAGLELTGITPTDGPLSVVEGVRAD